MAVLALPFMTAKQENLPNLDEFAENFMRTKESGETMTKELKCFTKSKTFTESYNRKMLGIFEDMCRLEYI
jgi:hypothetical protein